MILYEGYFNNVDNDADIVKDIESQNSLVNYQYKVSISFEIYKQTNNQNATKLLKLLMSYIYHVFEETLGIDDFDYSQLLFDSVPEDTVEDLLNYDEWYIDVAFDSSFRNWMQVTKFIQRLYHADRFKDIEVTALEFNGDSDDVYKIVSFTTSGKDWWMLDKKSVLSKIYGLLLNKTVDDAYSDARMGVGVDGTQGRIDLIKKANAENIEYFSLPVTKITRQPDIEKFFRTIRKMKHVQDSAQSDFTDLVYNVWNIKDVKDNELNLIKEETIRHNGYISLLVCRYKFFEDEYIRLMAIPSIVLLHKKEKLYHSFIISSTIERVINHQSDDILKEFIEVGSLFSDRNKDDMLSIIDEIK